MSAKLGKNEAKRLQAAALRDLHSEMDDDERERMLRKGMGGQEGGLIHKGMLVAACRAHSRIPACSPARPCSRPAVHLFGAPHEGEQSR